ncbi:MAG: glycosyltransferase family 1 protein, partial [Gammaproteobacteria bacterium]|nr:glycosyltransferase family 1 protein [Gammaproteobacteria bacterium]
DDVPHEWLKMVKASIGKLAHTFNAQRMVREYDGQFYQPAAERYTMLTEDNLRTADEFA